MENNKETVYDFAIGLEDGEKKEGRNLLCPEKAIFSAVMNIVSNKSESEQKTILGEKAFELLKSSLLGLSSGNINLFMDLVGETIHAPYTEKETITVPLRSFPGETRNIEVPKYSKTEKISILQEAIKDENSKLRLAVGKVIKEYFPVTADFQKRHFAVMDAELGIKGPLDRTSRLGKYPLN